MKQAHESSIINTNDITVRVTKKVEESHYDTINDYDWHNDSTGGAYQQILVILDFHMPKDNKLIEMTVDDLKHDFSLTEDGKPLNELFSYMVANMGDIVGGMIEDGLLEIV